MKSRAFGAVLLCLHVCLIALDFSTATDEPPAGVTESPNSDEHNKLLLECQHPDYRTYIKCLKRHKRHHRHGDGDGDGGDLRNSCFDECRIDHCETTKCVHECHKRCMKKTKETRQIITQYETTCDSGDCQEENKTADLPATNITTNIDINNVINNHIPKNEVVLQPPPGGNNGGSPPGGGPPGGGPPGGVPPGGGPPGGNTPGTNTCVGNVPYCCGGTPCSGISGWYGANAGLTLVPQIQLVPQITFGLGTGVFAGSGGGYWPHAQPTGVDCSPCGNPLLRYRCDVSCYANQATGPIIQNMGRAQVVNSGCQSPQCIGGT